MKEKPILKYVQGIKHQGFVLLMVQIITSSS